jgi:kynurenine 3-monooxygenase
LLPDLQQEFATRPTGHLGTVHCQPWHLESDTKPRRHLLLIGDAAHAIVPFHGQGMNAGFEDCAELDRMLAASEDDWGSVLPQFESMRRPNTEAIARMALENYVEMRDAVRDPHFERRAQLSFELERQFPGRFIPRYSMVMFHPEISYAEAETRGRIQAELLNEAMQETVFERALKRAAGLVTDRL